MNGIAIIGCGLIGQKRAKIICKSHAKLLACADQIKERADALAVQYPGCEAYSDWLDAIKHPDIDIVIIAVLHASLAEIALAAIQAGKHVLIEKPAGKHSSEISSVMQAVKE